MKQITIHETTLQNAAMDGMDAFVQVFVKALRKDIGGEPTLEIMSELSIDQMTLLCWDTLHEEVMNGGFVQLIHNGYGPYIFKNPFAKVVGKIWGMRDLSKRLYEVHSLWLKYREELEADCTDDEFMALFEQYPEFDDYDDWFVENEEELTRQVAIYIDNHLDNFAHILT